MHKFIHYIAFLLPLSLLAQTTFVIPDAGFKTCLIEKYPSVLDANENLIIESADTLSKNLICNNYDIVDISGIAYFRSVENLNLSINKIEDVRYCGLDSLKNLRTLKLASNLISFPLNTSKLVNLENYNISSNFISEIADLSENTKLRSLEIHSNQLKTLPDLSNLNNLELLNVARNETLTKPIDLSGLNNLQFLYAWLCNLNSIPSIAHLSNLKELNIAYNNLQEIPNISNNQKLEILYSNHNKLIKLPDFSANLALTKVRLYNNFLGLREIESTVNHPNYKNLFVFSPQEISKLQVTNILYSKQNLDLTIGDGYTGDSITFSWIKDGVEIWSGNKDTFALKNLSSLDNGKYSFQAKTNYYPSLVLTSDTVEIKITDCINPVGFNISTENADCNKKGVLSIDAFNQPNLSISYFTVDKNQDTLKFDQSISLKEGEYQVQAKTLDNCVADLGSKYIDFTPCKDPFFSPNGDGIDDTIYFKEDATISIYDKWGKKLQSFEGPITWDGKDKNGKLLPPGYYTIQYSNKEKAEHFTVIY